MSTKTEAQHILEQVESIRNAGDTDCKDIARELEEIERSAKYIVHSPPTAPV